MFIQLFLFVNASVIYGAGKSLLDMNIRNNCPLYNISAILDVCNDHCLFNKVLIHFMICSLLCADKFVGIHEWIALSWETYNYVLFRWKLLWLWCGQQINIIQSTISICTLFWSNMLDASTFRLTCYRADMHPAIVLHLIIISSDLVPVLIDQFSINISNENSMKTN